MHCCGGSILSFVGSGKTGAVLVQGRPGFGLFGVLRAFVLAPGGDSSADVALCLILVQDVLDLLVERLIKGGQALAQVLV